jgi:hypothetical protein
MDVDAVQEANVAGKEESGFCVVAKCIWGQGYSSKLEVSCGSGGNSYSVFAHFKKIKKN